MAAFKKDNKPKPLHNYTAPKIEKYRQITDTKTLTQGQRKTLWTGIQRDNPPLAEMLTNDPMIAELKAKFDAHIVFYTDEVIEYMKEQP